MPIAELSRRERKKKITRETLLAVALDIISKQGIYVTTIEDVTKKADIGKGTFYQYFSGKDELLETLLNEGLMKLLAQCREYSKGARNLKHCLRMVVKAHVEFLMSEESFVLIFHQVRGLLQLKQEISANLKEIYGDYLLHLSELLGKFSGPSLRNSERTRKIALSLASYSTGLINHYFLFHKKMHLSMDASEMEKRIIAVIQ